MSPSNQDEAIKSKQRGISISTDFNQKGGLTSGDIGKHVNTANSAANQGQQALYNRRKVNMKQPRK